MADEDLQAIRARRLAQLQQQHGGGNSNQQKQEEERKAQEAEFKNNILSQVLSQAARARLNTLRVAKPEKAAIVENMLVNMARMGQIGGQLGEDELKSLMERISEQTKQETTVKFDRRRAALDDDD